MDKSLKLSVHQLVDFLLRSGDIDNRVFNRSSMAEGTRLHRLYQTSKDDGYLSEYPLKHEFYIEGVSVELHGFADGITQKRNGDYVVEEIKTTIEDLTLFKEKNFAWHIGQAKCYAYLFALERKLEKMTICLLYIRQGKEKQRQTDYYTYSLAELEQEVIGYLEDYLDFYNIIFRQNEERDVSIKTLPFPFENYRDGQRELTKYAYGLAINGGRMFTEAPTGIGKTMSTLYPFIKSLSEDEKIKIFYLTAKTSGKEAAYKAVEILKEKGLKINDIVITAKEKMCPNGNKTCNPDECPFARGYYSKLQSVLRYALVNYSTFDYDLLMTLGVDNMMCPFELQLDLSLFCDVIICDYNYLFDPISYMKRYFDEDSAHYLALVDEAHNLVDRSREMYSAFLLEKTFLKMKKSLRHVKNPSLKRKVSPIGKMFEDMKQLYNEEETIVEHLDGEYLKVINSFVEAYTNINKEDHKSITKETTDFYLEANRFLKIGELVDEKYITYLKNNEGNMEISYYCLDASRFLRSITNRLKASLLFSATLTPIDYYMTILGGEEKDAKLILPSPFDRDHLKLLIAPKVSIKYKNRDSSYEHVKDYINSFIRNKVGNYFIYSPSYEYMNRLLEHFKDTEYNIFIQSKEMSDKDKLLFLDNFQENPQTINVGFLVIGGAFGEGIDLVSDRLIGVVIIGIGLPKINFQSNQIANYYKELELPGYDYAYTNPGMNKVMQAVGRVIRSENDKGAALLIDERYLNRNYRDLFRSEWEHYEVMLSPLEVEETITHFYKK